jgi:hypothetical protein
MGRQSFTDELPSKKPQNVNSSSAADSDPDDNDDDGFEGGKGPLVSRLSLSVGENIVCLLFFAIKPC